jgi:hypothetical protein
MNKNQFYSKKTPQSKPKKVLLSGFSANND